MGMLRDDPQTAGIALEVESDEHGPAEERELRARRIGFYLRNGAQVISSVTDYQMPNLAGPGGLPMKLLWIPLKPGADAPEGASLRQLVLNIYRFAYQLEDDDALVRQTLRSL